MELTIVNIDVGRRTAEWRARVLQSARRLTLPGSGDQDRRLHQGRK
jgi:hypothetical protein